jgi:hypothetical protein
MCYPSFNSVHGAYFKTKNFPEARLDSQPVGKKFRQQADYFKGGKTHVFTKIYDDYRGQVRATAIRQSD